MRAIPLGLTARPWPYADGAAGAIAEIGKRVAARGRTGQTLTYTEACAGLELRLPNVRGGSPFELGVPDWTELDRAILGELLGRLTLESLRRGDFLASAVVVSKESREPSEGFWSLMRELEFFTAKDPTRRALWWGDELARAFAWYASNDW